MSKKRRAVGVERINFILRLEAEMHCQLKRIADKQGKSMALVVEECLRYSLKGETAMLDRAEVTNKIADLEKELYPVVQAEVEVLLKTHWHQLTDRRRQALTYLAIFPYEPVYRVARMIHMTRQGLQKIRQSRFGVKVINHFLDKSLWSKRPDLLKSIINKAIQSNDSAWSELALRVFGDYSLWASKERKVEYKPTSGVPQNLDKQLIEQAKLLNMTPKRFRLLWQQNKKKGQAGNSA